MEELLQELWQKYTQLVSEIEELVDDAPINQYPFDKLNTLISDDQETADLRRRLSEAGVKGVGFVNHYPNTQDLTK